MPDRTLGGAPPHAPQVIGGAVEVVNNLTDSALAAPPADQPAAGRLYNGNKKKTKKMDKLKAKAKGNPGPGQTSEVFKEGLDNGFSAAVETVANPALTSQAAPILHKGLTGAGTKKYAEGVEKMIATRRDGPSKIEEEGTESKESEEQTSIKDPKTGEDAEVRDRTETITDNNASGMLTKKGRDELARTAASAARVGSTSAASGQKQGAVRSMVEEAEKAVAHDTREAEKNAKNKKSTTVNPTTKPTEGSKKKSVKGAEKEGKSAKKSS